LKRLIPNGAYYADEKATKDTLLKCVRPRLVHVATHGFFEADQPDPSTGDSNASEAARRLTALEMAGADWEGTQSVTLSACDTGVGDVRDGEGIYGVRRAMVLTGAVAGVITLWKVNDTATSELMRLFYDRLIRKHQSREEALRLAQSALLNTRERSNPFLWAGFIATGKDGPLR
jgi:CHAT domain-containing protein